MGPYRLLFSISVEHGFFSDGLLPGLRFEPAQNSAALLARSMLLSRSSPRGVQVYHDAGRSDALQLLADDTDGALQFRFNGYGGQPAPEFVSEPFLFADDATPIFDSENAVREDSGALRLHQGDAIAEQDMVVQERSGAPRRPLFGVQIRYAASPEQSLEQRFKGAADEYYLRFAAPRTYWKYYLLGSLSKRQLSIVDLDGDTDFEPLGETVLCSERPALAFRSTAPIALRQRSACRFQLRERSTAGERVLFKRLPVAGTGQVSCETINGNAFAVSEIYLNG